MNLAVWNARSIKARGKAIALCDFVKEDKINLFAITETWLTNSDRDARALAIINEALPNFDFHHVPRTSSSGGGVGFLVHKGFDVNIHPRVEVRSFEYMDISVSSPNTPSDTFQFLVIYRPPYSKKNNIRPSHFFEELTSILESLHGSARKVILAGDFNLHMDVAGNPDSAAFMELLDMFGLQNHVDFPTHSSGHTLDLILTGRDTKIVSGVRNHPHLPSDHIAVSCQLDIGRPGVIRKHISCRNLKSIDMDTFLRDLSSAVNVDVPDDISSLTSLYDTALRTVLDSHAPIKERHVILRSKAPWYNASLRQAKQLRRRCERRMMLVRTAN